MRIGFLEWVMLMEVLISGSVLASLVATSSGATPSEFSLDLVNCGPFLWPSKFFQRSSEFFVECENTWK